MDCQKEINWTDAAWRSHLARCGLTDVQIRFVTLLAREGKPLESDDSLTMIQASKREAAKKLGCSPNGVTKAAACLKRMGLIEIITSDNKQISPVYVLHILRARSLEAAQDRLAELTLFDTDWSPVVTTGHLARDSVNEKTHRVRVPCSNRDRDSMGPVTTGDQSRPWQSMTDVDLVRCVASRDLKPLRRLYDEALKRGWIEDCEDAKLRFLTICHHAATSAGLTKSRMGNVVARTKRQLDVQRVRQESEEWAAAILRARHRDPELVDG